MALIYQATLKPKKLDLISAWAPAQPWFEGDATAGFARVGAYRFDDPEGEVGVEVMLVRAGDGPLLQVPLTYRAAPLDGAEGYLLGTMEHSVLGTRYTYDGAGDPVFISTAASAALTGGTQADMDVVTDDGFQKRAPDTTVEGSGTADVAPTPTADIQNVDTSAATAATVIVSGNLRVTLLRVLTPGAISADATATLAGIWPGESEPTTLLLVSRD